MKPVFIIRVSGNDITAKIADRLLFLKITDEAGIQSDAVEIRLDNRPDSQGGHLRLPPSTRDMTVALGYEGKRLMPMGLYTVDDVGLSGPPDVVTIKAKAARWMTSLKAPRSRSWHAVTLGDMVRRIAADNNYEASIAAELANVVVAHVDQTEESDAHLLTRLSQDYGAIAKPAGGHLIFVPRGESKTATGKSAPSIAVTFKDDVLQWSYSAKDRGKYDAVEAEWQDLGDAQLKVARAGDGQLVYRLRHSYPDEAAALAAAEAKLAAFERGQATLQLTVIGNPEIQAESPINLTGFHPAIPTRWVANTVTHTIDAGGFRTEVGAELPRK
ncbi:MAG: phage tail protein [Rhodospirillales bacterium]|nr:phage tail protein [Rhodospirillales bacterium]